MRDDDDGVSIDMVTNLDSEKVLSVDDRGVEGMRVDADFVVVRWPQTVNV